MEYETLLNVEQVAQMLGLSVSTIRKWVLIRYIPYRKIGKAVRFSASEIQGWIKKRSVVPLKNPQGRNDTPDIGGGEK
jgi:excisionase family DNA binding protein